MAIIRLGDLATYTGDPSGSYLIINDSTNTATYKIQREAFIGINTGSFATTGSNSFNGNQTINGNITASNSLFTGTITAQTLTVQYITASTELITGSSKFGTQLSNTHQFTGSVSVTGSLSTVGDTTIKGSGNTSGTTALTVQNSDASNLFRVLNNGLIGIGNSADRPFIFSYTTSSGTPNLSGTNLSFYNYTGTQSAAQGMFSFENTSAAQTSGTNSFIRGLVNFQPTSGTGLFSQLLLLGTINQTGGANGITRGLYVSPTLTSAADWRSIEWSNNAATSPSQSWGLYGAGSARNYLAGRLQLGSTGTLQAGVWSALQITGATIASGIYQLGQVQTDVTSTAIGFWNAIQLAPSGVYGSYQHYRADEGTIGAGSTLGTQTGYLVAGLVTGTTIYGFRANIALGSNRWNLYMDGTAANYLNGNLLIGSTTDSGEKLQVTGTAKITSDLQVTGSLNAPNITGSLFGTSSWARNALTASYVPSTAIVGDLSRIATGSITASVNINSASFQITSGSSRFLLVSSSGTTVITPTAEVPALIVSGYSLTGGSISSAVDISGSWNTLSTPQSLIKANVSNIASAGAGRLIELQVDGSSIFHLDRFSRLTMTSHALSRWLSVTGDETGISFSGTSVKTSGIATGLSITGGLIVSSGTSTLNHIALSGTINQTGTATGITRGVYVNPTITSAADWRSIEWSNASGSGWGLYGSGTAPNYLAGNLGIGTTALTNRTLSIIKNITGNPTSYGIINLSQIQSDVTNSARIYYSEVGTQATSFTLNNLTHFYAVQGVFGVGSSVTDQIGFYAHNTLIGATNNYGFYGNIPSGSNRWNLYMNGTADNYLAGSLGIGTTSLTGVNLNISKALTGALISKGISLAGQVQSDSTNGAYYIQVVSSTQAASFTVSGLSNYIASQGTFGAGSTVSEQNGFHVSPSLIGANLNIGFRGRIPSGSNRWNLYMDGTANNYLAGNLGIGTTSLTDINLSVSKALTGSAGPIAVLANGTISSTSTTAAAYFFTSANVQNSTFTLPRLVHYEADQSTIGASATVTTQVGFRVRSTLTGATNNYGFQGEIASATNRWNLYMNGTAANYLNGNLLIGSTTDSGEKLQVTGTAKITSGLQVTGSLNVTGSITLTNLLTLATQNPLPTVNVPSASLMASGSGTDLKPYFWNGSAWTALY